MNFSIVQRTLHFRRPATTSRGVYNTRLCTFVTFTDQDGSRGTGECSPLPDLSCDAIPDYLTVLEDFCRQVCTTGKIPYVALRPYPSMLFGIETALESLKSGSYPFPDTPFARGKTEIPINGLVWMGPYEEMAESIETKLEAGFKCIKLKIGALDFDRELELLERIRSRFPAEVLELRVDANGAFSPTEAPERLERLSRLGIHSIEQPIRAGQTAEMTHLCRTSPVPIALDEELIGINDPDAKIRLLSEIRPAYIVLKPSLHGGMAGCREWISMGRSLGIGSWITSALESNLGLTSIARFAADVYGPDISMPQGLGTGLLFTDNLPSPLHLSAPYISNRIEVPAGEVTLHTSGSTGKPKEIKTTYTRLKASALKTLRFLGLKPGDRALLCLDPAYIAGLMMRVRAVEGGLVLDQTAPSGNPLADTLDIPYDLVAMVSLQVCNSLQEPAQRRRLSLIRNLIIGGGMIHPDLEKELRLLPENVRVWCTYGMTETLSHIAMRRVNGPDASLWYTPLPGARVSLGPDKCLLIDARDVHDGILHTNDIAEIRDDGCFRIIGRRDNIVCSGGIKIQIEEVEEALSQHIHVPFMIAKRASVKFGEEMVLLHVGGDKDSLRTICREVLPAYHIPREIIAVDCLPLTLSGKPIRQLDT